MTASAPSGGAEHGGSEALGLVLLTPVLLAAALGVLWISRLVDTQAQVHSVAEASAHAAALQRDRVGADSAARQLALSTLGRPEICADLQVAVDLREFVPGGRVAVEIICTVARPGRESLVSSPRQIRVWAQAPIDRFRELNAASPSAMFAGRGVG